MAPGSNQMARVAAKRHSRCQHLPRKRHPPHAAIAAQLRPMQQKPTGRHPGNGRRRHSWQGRRHVKKARRNQCQRKAGTIAPAKKLTTTSHHPTADAAYRPFGTPKRHVSTCETCRFAAKNGTSQKAANLTSQPSASQSVSLSSANRGRSTETLTPTASKSHSQTSPVAIQSGRRRWPTPTRPSRENAAAEAQPT